jgi:FtsX-like permease family protein
VAARQLALATGDVVAVRDRVSGARLRMRISGVYAVRNPASRYWGLDTLPVSGVSTQPGFANYGPVIVAAAALAPRGPLAVGAASWVALPDPARIQAGQLDQLASRIRQAGAHLRGSVRLGGLQQTSGLPALLTGLSRSLAVARSMLAISALQLLLLAAAALALATRLLTGHREDENALLSARGAARWQLARITIAETVLLAAVAAAAGALAGTALAALLVRAGALRSAGLQLTGIPASAWLAAGLVLVLCLAIALWPALRPPPIRRGRQATVAGIIRSGADIALVVLALLAVHELRAYSAVTHLSGGGLGIDPVLAIAPALALAAVSLILLRLLPVAARLLERLVARSRHLGAALASWEISRRAVRQSGPVLLALLAVATGTLALAQFSSWRQSARDQAAFTAGADVRADTTATDTLARSGIISHLPGVTAAMPVSRVTATSRGTVVALGARQAAGTVLLRPDLSALPARALWRRITPAGPPPGLDLPGRPARLQITASMARARGAAGLGRVAAAVTIQDASGAIFTIGAGSLPADGRRHALVASLSPGRQAAYPLRLLGLTLTYSLPAYPAPGRAAAAQRPATVAVWRVAESAAAAGAFAAPLPLGRALASWQAGADAGSLSILSTLPVPVGDKAPAVTGARPGPGGARLISVFPGNGPDPSALAHEFGPSPFGYLGTVTLQARPPERVIPAIATQAFLTSGNLRPGAVIAVALDGTRVPVRIVAAVSRFPTTGGGVLIVDQGALGDLLASQGAAPLTVSQWWLRTAAGAVPAGLPGGSAVTDRDQVQAALLSNSLSAAPPLEGLAIAAAAAVLAAVGFSVGVAASLRARRSQSALLAALGYSASAQARGLCLEELMLTVPAALAGLGVGIGLAHLLVPAITLTPAAITPVPAVLVQTPLGWAIGLTLVVAAIPVAVAAAAVARRPDPAAGLRAAEQA